MNKLVARVAIATAIAGSVAMSDAKPYAIFHTDKGDFTAELYPDKAPKTVENFIGLATGKKTWQHPSTKEVMKNKPLYNNTKFHRTMPNFMIQGGDPLGTGRGGPGYQFPNEDSDLTFDRAGRLAMANAGRDTNGSQFFVTVAAKDYLNGGYTIFGQVVKGQDVVNKISELPSEAGSGRALQPVTLKSVEIVQELPGAGTASASKSTSGTDSMTSKTKE
jgi:peptidyl-prolyl cis-trans isomerase A (cyclophilin A)